MISTGAGIPAPDQPYDLIQTGAGEMLVGVTSVARGPISTDDLCGMLRYMQLVPSSSPSCVHELRTKEHIRTSSLDRIPSEGDVIFSLRVWQAHGCRLNAYTLEGRRRGPTPLSGPRNYE